jgi:hypothetical protein
MKTRNQTKKTKARPSALFHNPEITRFEEFHENRTKVKYIEKLRLGDHEMTTLCYSPFPEEYEKVR